MGLLGDIVGGAADLLGLGGAEAPTIAPFKPTDVVGPYGTAQMVDGQYQLQLSPQLQTIQNNLFRQLGGSQTALSPVQQAFASQAGLFGRNIAGSGMDVQNLAGQLPGYGSQLAGFSGALGAMQPGLAGIGGMFTGAGAGALGMGMSDLAQAGAIDPMSVAASQMERMQALLEPRRQRELGGLESRLMQQGLLGSTAGGEQFRALREANQMQDLGLASQALEQGYGLRGQALNQALGVGGFGQGLLGAGADISGLRANLLGQQANLTTAQANLLPMQAGLFSQGAGLMGTGLGMMGTGVDLEQQARSNWLNNLQAMQGLGQGLFSQAGLGMQGGQAQAAINHANAQMQFDAAKNRSDMISGLVMGGLGAMSGNPMMALGGLFGGGGGMPTPQLFMQNPYGGMNTGVNIPNVNTGLNLGFNPTGGMF